MSEAPAGEWHGSIPADVQGHTALSTFKNDAGGIGSLAKSYVELSKKFSEPVIERLDLKDAGTRDKVLTKLGRPDRPEAYGLKDANFAAVAHKAGLAPEQAKALADHVEAQGASLTAARADERKAAMASLAASTATALKGEWGAKYDAEVALMNKGLENNKFFSKDFRDKLAETGLIHHPDLARLANQLGHAAQEGKFMSGTGDPGAPGTAEAFKADRIKLEREMIELRGKPGFDPTTPEFQALVARRSAVLSSEAKAMVAKQQEAL